MKTIVRIFGGVGLAMTLLLLCKLIFLATQGVEVYSEDILVTVGFALVMIFIMKDPLRRLF